jgi:hypothetical protein
MYDGLDLMDVFGHHSKLRRLKSLEPLTILYPETKRYLSDIYGEALIAEVFIKRGYRIEVLAE